jgi:hypothetical protein
VRDDDYLVLELVARGLLHDLRMLYAEQGGPFRESFAERRLLTAGGHEAVSERTQRRPNRDRKVAFTCHLESLNDAGLIALVACKPLALETETETETETTRALALESLGTIPNPAPATARADPDQHPSAFGHAGAVLDLLRLLDRARDKDGHTPNVVRAVIRKHRLAEGAIRSAIEVAQSATRPAAAAVAEFNRHAQLKNGDRT